MTLEVETLLREVYSFLLHPDDVKTLSTNKGLTSFCMMKATRVNVLQEKVRKVLWPPTKST